ncbi:MAG: CDP-6-deoxy-delta-3,4-glucoseen reductase [Gammaproteobacteria bacterium]
MSFTITNRRNQSAFTANPGETILDAALRDARVFPYGCRSGACGACKSTLVSGKVDYGEYEEFALSDAEIAQGKALLCQAVALEDVVIDADEIMTGQHIQIKMLPCRVMRLEKSARDVMRVFLMLPKSQEFHFIPGQYIDIILKDGLRRSFSLANLPQRAREDGLELHIRHVPGGRFTPRVFTAMRERDLLRFEGPFGTYFLREDEARPVIMVAGGTGFAPLKALIQQALEADPARRIHLFWGARDAQDIYMHTLAEEWARARENFCYTPVLSAPPPPRNDDWHGARGWVHESVLAAYDDFAAYDVYASGPPVMVDAVRDRLGAKGMRAERFFFDSFTYAPRA